VTVRLETGSRPSDEALVVLQYLQPGGYIGGMIVAKFGRNAEISAKKSRTQLRDQLLAGVTFITPFGAAHIAG
jgi:hypothetical protein